MGLTWLHVCLLASSFPLTFWAHLKHRNVRLQPIPIWFDLCSGEQRQPENMRQMKCKHKQKRNTANTERVERYSIFGSQRACTTFMCQMWTLQPFISCNLNICDIRFSFNSANSRPSRMAAGAVFAISYAFACNTRSHTHRLWRTRPDNSLHDQNWRQSSNQIPIKIRNAQCSRRTSANPPIDTSAMHNISVCCQPTSSDVVLSFRSRTFELFPMWAERVYTQLWAQHCQ